MVDQQDGERAKGHSFLIENILSRDDRPKQDEPTKQNCIAFPTRSNHHSTGVNDTQDIFGCSEDNTNSSSECHPQIRHKKKTRTVFSRHQIFYLESAFEMKRYLSSTERSEMARTLKLSETQVKVWFQNRRNKWKSQINGQDSYSPETPLYPPPFSAFAVDPRLQQRLTMLHPMSPLFY